MDFGSTDAIPALLIKTLAGLDAEVEVCFSERPDLTDSTFVIDGLMRPVIGLLVFKAGKGIMVPVSDVGFVDFFLPFFDVMSSVGRFRAVLVAVLVLSRPRVRDADEFWLI